MLLLLRFLILISCSALLSACASSHTPPTTKNEFADSHFGIRSTPSGITPYGSIQSSVDIK